MPKAYRIGFSIDDAQAQGAFKRGVAGMEAVERAAKKTAAAQEAAAKKAAQSTDKETERYMSALMKKGQLRERANAKELSDMGRASSQLARLDEKRTDGYLKELMRRGRSREAANALETTETAKQTDRYLNDLMRKGQSRERANAKELSDMSRGAAQLARLDDKRTGDYLNALMRKGQLRERENVREAIQTVKTTELARRQEDKKTDDYLNNLMRRGRFREGENRREAIEHDRRVQRAKRETLLAEQEFAASSAGAMSLRQQLLGVGAAYLSMQAGRAVVHSIASAMQEARDSSMEMAREVLGVAASLREIVFMTGGKTVSDAEIGKHIAYRKATGMSHETAKAVRTGFGNVIGTVSDAHMAPAEKAKLDVMAGQLAARITVDDASAQAVAEATAMTAAYMKGVGGKPLQAADVADKTSEVMTILGGGASINKVMADEYQKVLTAVSSTGELKGTFTDPSGPAFMTAMASAVDKHEAGSLALRAIRPLRSFTKFRKMKGLKTSAAKTLQSAKLTEDMDPHVAMMKFFQFADTQMKPDEAFDVWMGRQGFRNIEENRDLGRLYAKHKTGEFERFYAKSQTAHPAGTAAADAAGYLATDVARQGVGKATVDEARVNEGKRARELELQTFTPEAKLIQQGLDTTWWGSIVKRGAGLGVSAEWGRQNIVQARTLSDARARAGEYNFRQDSPSDLINKLDILIKVLTGNAADEINRRKEVERIEQIWRHGRPLPGAVTPPPLAGGPVVGPIRP